MLLLAAVPATAEVKATDQSHDADSGVICFLNNDASQELTCINRRAESDMWAITCALRDGGKCLSRDSELILVDGNRFIMRDGQLILCDGNRFIMRDGQPPFIMRTPATAMLLLKEIGMNHPAVALLIMMRDEFIMRTPTTLALKKWRGATQAVSKAELTDGTAPFSFCV